MPSHLFFYSFYSFFYSYPTLYLYLLLFPAIYLYFNLYLFLHLNLYFYLFLYLHLHLFLFFCITSHHMTGPTLNLCHEDAMAVCRNVPSAPQYSTEIGECKIHSYDPRSLYPPSYSSLSIFTISYSPLF